MELIADGKAPKIPQTEDGATYDKIWKKKEVAKVSQVIYILTVRLLRLLGLFCYIHCQFSV